MLPFAPDAWPYVWKLAAGAAVFRLLGWSPLAWLLAGLAGFTLFFFRDPERQVPMDPRALVSPADGTVLSVERLPEHEFLGGPAVKISIFLSVFNVHINRSPITGTVRFQNYRAGKMLPAFKSHASEVNERNAVGIEGRELRVVVHQITGFIARRIVSRVKPGDQLMQGQRFGLIKFGSCTELIVPEGLEILAAKGDKVRGGETVLARLPKAAP